MCTFCTRAITDLTKPTFGENFPIAISKSKLIAKTLQVNIWTIDAGSREECLGSAQVSMADFKTATTSVKWYNVLSFHFMQAEPAKKPSPASRRPAHLKQESELSSMTSSRQGTLKEESSDESTIISSQTSTLTRNMGPEAMMSHSDGLDGAAALSHPEFSIDGAITVQVENTDEDDEDEEDEEEEDFMINENTVILDKHTTIFVH